MIVAVFVPKFEHDDEYYSAGTHSHPISPCCPAKEGQRQQFPINQNADRWPLPLTLSRKHGVQINFRMYVQRRWHYNVGRCMLTLFLFHADRTGLVDFQ
jgi:hypothetical protein